ncbi:MAG: alanine racemase [Colwellia sp.]
MTYISRRTQAVIDLCALKENYHQIANLAKKSQTIAVIKANAYGHGAVKIALSMQKYVPAFAVAFIDEAIVLREAGVSLPILILEGALTDKDFALAEQNNFWLMIHNPRQIDWLTNLTPAFTGKLWLKIDSGMNRLGFMPQETTAIINRLSVSQQSNLVLCSHFSTADDSSNNNSQQQLQLLQTLAKQHNCQYSIANSAGILNWPQSHANFNRLGIALYGASPIEKNKLPVTLKPVMTLQSNIIALRELTIGQFVGYGGIWQAKRPTIIATIAIGYADGYPRHAKSGTPVWLVNNQKTAPIVGRVSMDMITIDVTDIEKVNIGDAVELWGNNLAVEVVASHADTINYELLTRVSDRVPRIYQG